MKRKTYTKPVSMTVEITTSSMLAVSYNDEVGGPGQLSNRQEVSGWDASAWQASEEETLDME